MTQEVLNEILAKHELWYKGKKEGERANLQCASLQDANMQNASLHHANMQDAYMQHADMRYADLREADMRGADMRGVDIDYSAWPLWCGSLKAHVDNRIAIQLLYHALSVVQHSPYVSEDIKRTLLTPDVVGVANRFHRVNECGELEAFNGGGR